MSSCRLLLASGWIVGLLVGDARAQHHHRPDHPTPPPTVVASESNPAPPAILGYASGGWARAGSTNTFIPSYLLGTPGLNYQAATSAQIPGGLGLAFPLVGVPLPSPMTLQNQPGPGGLMLPKESPTGSSALTSPTTTSTATQPTRSRAGRVEELVGMGDRSFRIGNLRRAEERYQQALKADTEAPDPRIRLAQVSLVRGDYNRASTHFRDAVLSTQSPGWLLQPRDVQAMFNEPGDFARQLAQLESHLQAYPQDRNAWFVLGVEQHLSGRPGQAHDTFLRLTDRPADPALSAFLDATTIARRSESNHDPAPPSVR